MIRDHITSPVYAVVLTAKTCAPLLSARQEHDKRCRRERKLEDASSTCAHASHGTSEQRTLGSISRHISPSFLPRSKNDRPGFSSLTCSRTVLENSTNEVAGFFGPPWGILLRRFRPFVAGSAPAAALPALPTGVGAGGYPGIIA